MLRPCDPGMTFPMCSSFSGIGTTSTCLVFVQLTHMSAAVYSTTGNMLADPREAAATCEIPLPRTPPDIVEISDDCISNLVMLSVIAMSWDPGVNNQQIMCTHQELEREIDKSTRLDHVIAGLELLFMEIPSEEGKLQQIVSKDMENYVSQWTLSLIHMANHLQYKQWDPGVTWIVGAEGIKLCSTQPRGTTDRISWLRRRFLCRSWSCSLLRPDLGIAWGQAMFLGGGIVTTTPRAWSLWALGQPCLAVMDASGVYRGEEVHRKGHEETEQNRPRSASLFPSPFVSSPASPPSGPAATTSPSIPLTTPRSPRRQRVLHRPHQADSFP